MKEENLKIFAKLISKSYYFTKTEFKKNLWKWYDDSHDHIVIFNESPHEVNGMQEIGQWCAALDLCCTARWSFFNNRLEIDVH